MQKLTKIIKIPRVYFSKSIVLSTMKYFPFEFGYLSFNFASQFDQINPLSDIYIYPFSDKDRRKSRQMACSR